MSGTETTPEYWAAYDCGHYTRRTSNPPRGIAWCEVCRRYVGVVVQRIEEPRHAH